MNGRIYSVDVTPIYEAAIPLKDILETGYIDERFFLHDEDMSKWIYAKGAKRSYAEGKMERNIIFQKVQFDSQSPWINRRAQC